MPSAASASSSASSSKRQSAAVAARQHTADTTIDTRHHVASHSPFLSPSSSFVPPLMPATHDWEEEDIDVGVAAKAKTEAATVGLAAVETATTPTPSSILVFAFASPIPNTSPPTPTNINTSISTPSTSASAKHTSLSSSRPAPASPSAPPSRRQSLSKRHSQLSQSHQFPVNSRRASTLSTALNSSASNAIKASGDLSRSSMRRSSKRSSRPSTSASTSAKKLGINNTKPTTPTLASHKSPRGTIHIRDFAYPTPDPHHTMSGPDTPKLIRKILKKCGPPSHPSSRRISHRSSISSGIRRRRRALVGGAVGLWGGSGTR
ncbi:hypothetical protein M422DRAFT_268226 [Sphaerobolus stellatus SS14]|uniref:Uncharacterized protein n=1 Tax=Sphaerobolus stellatus (strain SS14) TaxID=990650 RepID=A0A0C9TKG7_SPHS4|nr:hypothetical protein M422DRAFT_268226 [Sphaerobolus stellatus SS14]